MSTIIKNGKTFHVREDSIDDFVINEPCYDKVSYSKDQVWLDIGANIGAFCVKFADKVSTILAVEPESDNFVLLNKNLAENNITNVKVLKAAVVGNNDTKRSFYVNTKKNKGLHSLIKIGGRSEITVDCVNINKILTSFPVTAIKVDTEGGEVEILDNIENYSNIKEIIMEYHFTVLKDMDHSIYDRLISKLQSFGFKLISKPPVPFKSKTAIIHLIKE